MTRKTSLVVVLLLVLLCAIVTNAASQTCRNDEEIPPSTPTSQFNNNGDGTVTDGKTGLMWARCAIGLSGPDCTVGGSGSSSWPDALNLAQSSTLAGYDDWRLPNIKELRSIVEEQCFDPPINLVVFPNTPSSFFFSSSPSTDSNITGVWGVYFDKRYGYSVVFNTGRVRLVRSGP